MPWNQIINDEGESCILMNVGSGGNHGEAISGLLLKYDYDDAGKGSTINIPSQSKDSNLRPSGLEVQFSSLYISSITPILLNRY
jgi:hypothetical protein